MPKFTSAERILIKSIVASLSIKRIPELSWYKTMRDGQYEYVHEFKERINEILFLQKKHHQIVMRNEDNPQIQQTSLAELHRLSITLSNLYDVAPTIIGVGANATISITPETKTSTTATEFIV